VIRFGSLPLTGNELKWANHNLGRIGDLLRHQLVGNVLSLYAIQGLNYLVPLIVLPYLLRVLRPTGYGAIVMAQALMGYAMVVTDFGFNLTAARDISVARNDATAVARIYWTTIAAKVLLLVTSLAIIAFVVSVTPSFRVQWPIFLACSLMVVGNVVFPQWYLQGLERLKDSALIQASAKVGSAGATFIFVRGPEDLWIAAVISSIPALLGVGIAAVLAKPLFPATFHRPTWIEVRAALHGSWDMFTSTVSTTLYGTTTTLVLGIMAGAREVALYNLAVRLVSALQSVASPLTQAVFPRASLLFRADPDAAWRLIKRMIRILLPGIGGCALLLGLLAPIIVRLVGGTSFVDAVPLVRIMAIVPVVLGVGGIPAQIILVATGKTKELSQIYLRVGILNLIVMLPLIHALSATGAALSLTLAETLATAQMIHLSVRGYRDYVRRQ
jgi:polysaccharide transporter, PST family